METAVAARRFLVDAGYSPEYHEYDMGHEISGEVLSDLVLWLNQVLPPLDALLVG
jgi:predicted esterase